MREFLYRIWLLVFGCLLLAGCSAIDDDLSDCPPDPTPTPTPEPPTPDEENYELNYELRLITNITTEINTQLTTSTDVNVANALRSHLQNIFTDYAHDVDLSFYDTDNDQERLSHDQHVMNASEKSYTLYLPMREYMHLAVANIQDNHVIDLQADDYCRTSQLALATAKKDTIDSHNTGLFTARQPMTVLEGVDQTFNVKLYMANCAAALVIDSRGYDYRDIKVYSTGFATDFLINDSVYAFADKSPIVRTTKLDTEGASLCFCSVNFPTKEKVAAMRTVIETEEPFEDEESAQTFWQFRCYLTKTDGTITESILSVREVLRAGQFRIIRAYIGNDGEIQTSDPTVGVSVTLDWNDGGHHQVDL